MGPNGSGKSTLAYAIAGSPQVPGHPGLGHAGRRGRAGHERGRPRPGRAVPRHAVPGRRCRASRCRTSCAPRSPRSAARRRRSGSSCKELRAAMADLSIDPVFAERNVNEGFSGGEKKRHEILQMQLLNPKIAILDETDSGLDIDALKVVADGINRFRASRRPRRAADHPLHPDPAVRAARLRARVRRRPDRQAGRPRAGRGAGDQRLRGVRARRAHRHDGTGAGSRRETRP